jgi:hypothetical protein
MSGRPRTRIEALIPRKEAATSNRGRTRKNRIAVVGSIQVRARSSPQGDGE